MWESISKVLTSENGIQTEIIVVSILVLFFIAAKLGIISVSGKWLRVGRIKDDERTVLREQINYISSLIDLEENTIKEEGMDKFRTLFVLSKVKSFFITLIIFNSIRTDDSYIEINQQQLYSLVLSLTELEVFRTEAVKKHIYDLADKAIKRLYEIRHTRTK